MSVEERSLVDAEVLGDRRRVLTAVAVAAVAEDISLSESLEFDVRHPELLLNPDAVAAANEDVDDAAAAM